MKRFNSFLLKSCIGIFFLFLANKSMASVLCPTITVNPAQATVCAGQTLALVANGANTYTWTQNNSNPQFTASIVVSPTTSSLFKVVGSDLSGCKDSVQVVIVVHPQPVITINSNNPLICMGGSAFLNAGPAGSQYTYQWDANTGGAQSAGVVVSPTVTTVYGVTVTNASTGCSNTRTIQVEVYDPLASLAGPDTVCAGSPLAFNINGSSISTGFSVSPAAGAGNTFLAGNVLYTLSIVSVSNGINCPDTDTIRVIGLNQPTITISASSSSICASEPVVITAGGALNYSWSATGSGSSITVVPAVNNSYSVTGIGANGCSNSATISIAVLECVGLHKNQEARTGFWLYPNPSNGVFTIQSDHDLEISIFAVTGQKLSTLHLTLQNSHGADLQHLPEGLYIVASSDGENKILVIK